MKSAYQVAEKIVMEMIPVSEHEADYGKVIQDISLELHEWGVEIMREARNYVEPL